MERIVKVWNAFFYFFTYHRRLYMSSEMPSCGHPALDATGLPRNPAKIPGIPRNDVLSCRDDNGYDAAKQKTSGGVTSGSCMI